MPKILFAKTIVNYFLSTFNFKKKYSRRYGKIFSNAARSPSLKTCGNWYESFVLVKNLTPESSFMSTRELYIGSFQFQLWLADFYFVLFYKSAQSFKIRPPRYLNLYGRLFFLKRQFLTQIWLKCWNFRHFSRQNMPNAVVPYFCQYDKQKFFWSSRLP